MFFHTLRVDLRNCVLGLEGSGKAAHPGWGHCLHMMPLLTFSPQQDCFSVIHSLPSSLPPVLCSLCSQGSPEFLISLPLPPKPWGYRGAPPPQVQLLLLALMSASPLAPLLTLLLSLNPCPLPCHHGCHLFTLRQCPMLSLASKL